MGNDTVSAFSSFAYSFGQRISGSVLISPFILRTSSPLT